MPLSGFVSQKEFVTHPAYALQRNSFSSVVARHAAAMKYGRNRSRTLAGWFCLE
jgi:hypothetical protein